MQTKERTSYRVTYFKDQKHWDNGDYYYEDFDDLNNAMTFGKSNENGFGFQVERVEQIYRNPPSGYVYRKQRIWLGRKRRK